MIYYNIYVHVFIGTLIYFIPEFIFSFKYLIHCKYTNILKPQDYLLLTKNIDLEQYNIVFR